MSRAAVLSTLRSDEALAELVAPENILTNYSLEGRPKQLDPGAFIVLRWEESERGSGVPSVTRVLTVWAHFPAEKSSDYSRVDAVLAAVKTCLTAMEHVEGQDGYTVTCIQHNGDSPDLKDDAFGTISRNSTYRVLSRISSVSGYN